jgi:hypothetical protein
MSIVYALHDPPRVTVKALIIKSSKIWLLIEVIF